jgi:glycosyltransferase involved in cell wall biosynthesis
VTLYTTAWPEYDSKLSITDTHRAMAGFTTHVYPAKPGPWGSKLPHSPDLLNAVAAHAAEFDIVVTHSLWNPVATFARRALRKQGKPYFIMPHGMLDPVVFKRGQWKKLAWALFWERRNVEEAALIIFNTQAEQQKARSCGWHLPKSIVVPHVIDVSGWRNLPPRSAFERIFPQVRGREVILFVGRVNWVKNLDKLLDALAIVRLQRPSAALVCVGPSDNGHRAELERTAKAMGLGDSVLFTGMLKDEQLKAAYARGNVLTLVSQKENFGLAAAEALAAGLPVVVSTGVDLSADWESKGPIRRVTPRPQDIAAAISDLLNRAETHGLPDADAQALAEKEWGQSNVANLLDLYRSILTAEQL